MEADYKKRTDKEVMALFNEAVTGFKGLSNELESAIGAYMLGRHVGWKPLLLIHDKKTLRKYEKILNINFREHLEPEGTLANKSVAFKAAKAFGNFWKAVSGHEPGIRSNKLENTKR